MSKDAVVRHVLSDDWPVQKHWDVVLSEMLNGTDAGKPQETMGLGYIPPQIK